MWEEYWGKKKPDSKCILVCQIITLFCSVVREHGPAGAGQQKGNQRDHSSARAHKEMCESTIKLEVLAYTSVWRQLPCPGNTDRCARHPKPPRSPIFGLVISA